jgi:hypothetical protein
MELLVMSGCGLLSEKAGAERSRPKASSHSSRSLTPSLLTIAPPDITALPAGYPKSRLAVYQISNLVHDTIL